VILEQSDFALKRIFFSFSAAVRERRITLFLKLFAEFSV
jgi:hypothetical protein